MTAERRPDSSCPICLDCMSDTASPDCCVHTFCFPCIKKWSINSAQCPLCRRPIKWIFQSKTKTKWTVVSSSSSSSVTSSRPRSTNRVRVESNTLREEQVDDEAPSSSSLARVLLVSARRSESSGRDATSTEEENHVTGGNAEHTGERTLEQASGSERQRIQYHQGLSWRARGTRRSQYYSPSQSLSNRHRVSLPYHQWQTRHVFRDRSRWRGWNQSTSQTVHENPAAEVIWSPQTEGQAQFASAASEHRSSSSVQSLLPLRDAWRIEEEVPASEVPVDDETPSSTSSVRMLPFANERLGQRQFVFAEQEDHSSMGSVSSMAAQTPDTTSEFEGERVQLHNDPDLSWRPRGARRSCYHYPSHSLCNWRVGALPYHQRRMHPLSFQGRSDWRRWNQNPSEILHGNQSADMSHGARIERETRFSVTPSENITSSLVWSALPSPDDWTREEEDTARNMTMNDETPGPSSSARTLPIFDEKSESGQRPCVSTEEDCVIVSYAKPTVARTPGLASGSGGVHVQLNNPVDLSWRARSTASTSNARRFRYRSLSHLLSNRRRGSLHSHQCQTHHTWFRDRLDWRSCNQGPNETVRVTQAAELNWGAQRDGRNPFVVDSSEYIRSPSAWSPFPTHNEWRREEEYTGRDVSRDDETPRPSS